VGWHTFLAWLLLLFTKLFYELLDVLALTRAVARGVVYRTLCSTVIIGRHLIGALVTSWASASTSRSSSSCGSGGTDQWLVVTADFFVVVLVVAA
jgi:hypothetical protein